MGNRKQPFGYRMTLGEITIQPEETELRQAVETLRDSARWQAAHWQTWSVAAWRGQ